jgi:hypothetical protein
VEEFNAWIGLDVGPADHYATVIDRRVRYAQQDVLND